MKNTTQIKAHNDDQLFLFWGKAVFVVFILFFQFAFSATSFTYDGNEKINQSSDSLSVPKKISQASSLEGIYISSGSFLYSEGEIFVGESPKNEAIRDVAIKEKKNKKQIAQVEINLPKKISKKLNLPKQKIEIKPFRTNETVAFSKLNSVSGGVVMTQQIDLKYFISTKILTVILTVNDFENTDIYSCPTIFYNAASQASMSVRPPPFSV